mgnify:CR=1 FL=1
MILKLSTAFYIYPLACLSVFYKQLIPLLFDICKLFSITSKPIHALLASKRRPFGLQKMPFKALTNALLKSY